MVTKKDKFQKGNNIKTRTNKKTIYIGGTASILGILYFITLFSGVTYTHTGDIFADELGNAFAYINITSKTYNFCFEQDFKPIIIDKQNITYELQILKNNEWNKFNYKNDCINKGNTQLRIKFSNLTSKIKWSFIVDNAKINIDPYIYTIYDNPKFKLNDIENCTYYDNIISYSYCTMNNITNQSECFPEVKETLERCNKIGFNITLNNSNNYNIIGDCCDYKFINNYEFNKNQSIIICGQKINNICKTNLQQTSNNPLIFDEYGELYIIKNNTIIEEIVGSYEYIKNNNIKVSYVVRR